MADQRVLDAMEEVPRHHFVPKRLRRRAYDDGPLPIAEGQTISQPYVVAAMIDAAQVGSEDRVLAAKDVFIEKLVRRGLSMKALEVGDPMPSGKSFRLVGSLKQGIDKDNAKKITKILRDEGPKGVKAQIQGDDIRVSSKKRDDLQECMAILKKADLEIALQFTNYR